MAPPGGLCPDCWPLVRFLAEPLCQCCGAPMPDTAIGADECGRCYGGIPHYPALGRRFYTMMAAET
ncbi:MAG: double zinc ribbon domain-containing protein [Alphaproteobacteria bacterium]